MAIMRRYVLDMSQAAINRTAMYTITMDTLSGLANRFCGVQYFGVPRQGMVRPSDDVAIDGRLMEPLLMDPDRFVQKARRRSGSLSDHPRLFLDPLYVLFDELRPDDRVMVLDLSTVTKPDWHSPSVSRAYNHAFDKIASIRPQVSAISRNTADTLKINYAYPSERAQVVPLYVPTSRAVQQCQNAFRLASIKPYILFVGSLEVRKNLRGALRAFALSGLSRKGYELLVVGGHGHKAEEILNYARSIEGVRFLGYLSDAELCAVYAHASAFLYPSYLEGFGVPLLEAMSYGIPAVASNTGACPEVGGDLVNYYDPDDHEGFARELLELVAFSASQRQAYAEKAKKWIDHHYTLGRYLATLDQQLNQIVTEGI